MGPTARAGGVYGVWHPGGAPHGFGALRHATYGARANPVEHLQTPPFHRDRGCTRAIGEYAEDARDQLVHRRGPYLLSRALLWRVRRGGRPIRNVDGRRDEAEGRAAIGYGVGTNRVIRSIHGADRRDFQTTTGAFVSNAGRRSSPRLDAERGSGVNTDHGGIAVEPRRDAAHQSMEAPWLVQPSRSKGLLVFDDLMDCSTPVAKQPPMGKATRYMTAGTTGEATMGKLDPPGGGGGGGGDAAAGGAPVVEEKENVDPVTGLHARWRTQEPGAPGTPGNLRPLVRTCRGSSVWLCVGSAPNRRAEQIALLSGPFVPAAADCPRV